MEAIIASAKYKGSTNDDLTHGESYLIQIAALDGGMIIVNELDEVGSSFVTLSGSLHYSSVVEFLIQWEEITSYPSFTIIDPPKP